MYNKVFASNNQLFRKACELASVDPTRRQASKYQRGIGKAFLFKGQAKEKLGLDNIPIQFRD